MSKGHIQFISEAVLRPLGDLRKDCSRYDIIKKSSGTNHVKLDKYEITNIQEEKTITDGRITRVRRVFVDGPDSGLYASVGWILTADIDNCGICGTSFGLWTHKHHCKSCGNIICASCSPDDVIIEQLEECGPKRVCNQCFWGQEIVIFSPNLLGESVKTDLSNLQQILLENIPTYDPLDSKINKPTFNSNGIQENKPTTLKIEIPMPTFLGYSVSATPTPGFCIKAKLELVKVFINICHHTAVPYSDNNNSPTATKKERILFMVVGQIKETKDKEGELSMVFDVVINSDDLHIIQIDSTGVTRENFYKQLEKKVHLKHALAIDSKNFKVLRIANDYKYCDVNDVSPILIPPKNWFLRNDDTLAMPPIDVTKDNLVVDISSPNPLLLKRGSVKDVIKNIDDSMETVTIEPLPAWVIKTKIISPDDSGLKIFINVCHSDLVPLYRDNAIKTEVKSSRKLTTVGLLQQRYYIHLGYSGNILEKEVSTKLYTVLINSSLVDELQHPLIQDDEDPFTKKLNKCIIEEISMITDCNIDDDYWSRPKTKRGFKGDDLLPMIVSLPKKKFLFGVEQRTPSNSILDIKSDKHPEYNPYTPLPHDGSIIRGIIVRQNYMKNAKGSRRNTMFKLESVNKSASMQYVEDHPDLILGTNKSQLPLSTDRLVIEPKAGFVIEAVWYSNQAIYINVCHHPDVGSIDIEYDEINVLRELSTISNNSVDNGIDNIVKNQCILGTINLINSVRGDGKNIKVVALDVVIPSYLIEMMNVDTTEEVKENITIGILQFIIKMDAKLGSEFSFLPHKYMNNETDSTKEIAILPVFNILNQINPKLRKNIVFDGFLYKQGHNFLSFKKRRIQIKEGKLYYFDDAVCKGDFDIKNVFVDEVAPGECNAPVGTYPFKVVSNIGKGSFILFYALSYPEMRRWISCIMTQSRLMIATSILMNSPLIKMGWLKKEGQKWPRTFARRFVTIDMGVFKYYLNDSKGKNVDHGETLKGSVYLSGAKLEIRGDKRLVLTLELGKVIILELEDTESRNNWFKDFSRHIIFATEHKAELLLGDDLEDD